MINSLNSNILLDRIQELRNWDLSEQEADQLSFLEGRIDQRFPDTDVSKMDVRRINQSFSGKKGFKEDVLFDLLFNA